MSESTQKRVCTMCVLCLREDYGYSNYTTEGTTLACLAGLNPALEGQEHDTWREVTPELAAALDVALTCPRYREGAPAWLDVDMESIPYDRPTTIDDIRHYTDDDEAAALLLKRLSPPSPEVRDGTR